MNGPAELPQLYHVRLDVGDVERARAFYEQVLGLRPIVRYPIPGGTILQMGTSGRPPGVELWEERGLDVRPHPTEHVAFRVADVASLVERARRLGYEVHRPTFRIGDETVAFLRDPDGHLVELNDFRGR